MEELIPMFLGGLILGTPIVLILTKHQQKMTAMLHGIDQERRREATDDTNTALNQQISELREIVHQQTIAIDNLAKSQAEIQAALKSRTELSERVGA